MKMENERDWKKVTRLEVLEYILNIPSDMRMLGFEYNFPNMGQKWNICPMCGYKSNVTNLCRRGPMTPLAEEIIPNTPLHQNLIGIKMIAMEEGQDGYEFRLKEKVNGWEELEYSYEYTREGWLKILREHLENSPQKMVYSK